MYILILLLCFFHGFTHGEAPDQQTTMRDLIIILDDTIETNPDKGGACILSISKALMAESTPFLVNESLWQTFLELRQEWLLRSQIPDSDVFNITQYFADINKRINYWYSILNGIGNDELQIRSLIADKINEEFFTKEKCKELQEVYKLPNNYNYFYIMVLCTRFAVRCNFDAWHWFRLNNGYLLAIPKTYSTHYTNSSSVIDILNACGFSSYAHITDPLHMDPIQNMNLSAIEDNIVPSLENLFLADKQYTWSLYIMGHGCYYKLDSLYRQRAGGITTAKFKKICQFFNANLNVHLLWLNTCSAGGCNRLYLQNNTGTYHYTFVIESVNDSSTITNIDTSILYPKSNPLFYCTRDYIRKNTYNTSELWYNASTCFSRFFETIHTLYDNQEVADKKIQDSVYDASSILIAPTYFPQNTPYLLLPHSNIWLLCCPEHRAYVNLHTVLLAEVCNTPHFLHKRTTFVDAPILKTGLQIVNDNVEFITIITPGDSTHCIGPVNASELSIEKFVTCFWPLSQQECTKQVLFESITCPCNPEDPLIRTLGVTKKTVTFKDVFMRIVKTE